MIWTKLTRTNTVFSRATSAVFFCAGFWIFRYAGKIPKIYIKNQRPGSFRRTKGGPQGSQGAAKRVPGTAHLLPRHLPSWVGPTPLGALHGPLFILLSRKRRKRSRFSHLRCRAAATICSSSES